MGARKVEQGPVGESVRTAVAALRRQRRLSLNELSDLMSEAGRPVLPNGLHRIEQGGRRVDVDDLVALAACLGVAPGVLLGSEERASVLIAMSNDNPSGLSYADLAAVRKCSRCRCWVLPEDFDVHAGVCS